MPYKLAITLTLIATMISACASTQATPDAADKLAKNEKKGPLPHAELVASLPKTVETFDLAGAREFSTSGEGVTVQYVNARKHRHADVFLYPVAEENRELKHPDLVYGSTQATMRAIAQAVQQGIYKNLSVLDAATKANGLRTIARVQATYLRNNLASYTLVYQTEHDGMMVKIRVTMPDNDTNRESREWDRFADQIFRAVGKQLDSEGKAKPAAKTAQKLVPVDKPAELTPQTFKKSSGLVPVGMTTENGAVEPGLVVAH